MSITCIHCNKQFDEDGNIGTRNRNHCPNCLYSQHLDSKKAGDRSSECKGEMKPIALTFKNEKVDKYGKQKVGEIMLIHKCLKCNKISTNRIAGDDSEKEILKILKNSSTYENDIPTTIKILTKKDELELKRQLFGE